MLELNNLYHMDCMEGMAHFPDNFFDLAIVDPPYGGGSPENNWEAKKRGRFGGSFNKYDIKATRTSGGYAAKYGKNIEHWDTAPPPEYFIELFRVSKNQIIWGGNYFELPPTRCFVVWRKLTISESFSMAMCEYAWTSFNDNAKWFEIAPQGTKGEPRFHPTQKPIELYSKLLNHYAKDGFKILDTHVGSASSLIACHRRGLEFIGFELDEGYYDAAAKRLAEEMEQIRIDSTPSKNEQIMLSI